MTKPICIAVGYVKSTKQVTPERGKPFLSVKIDCPAIVYGENKRFTPRFEARVRFRYENLDLHPGDFVSVRGEASAESFEHQGKHLGALIIDRAEIAHIALPVREVEKGAFGTDPGEEESLPKPKTSAAPAATDGDDIPF